MSKLLDLSHWNKVTSWSAVKASKFDAVILKCSQGTSMSDPTFKRYQSDSRALGMYLGSYHFANGADPVKEADYYLDTLGEIKTGEILVLDYEITLAGAGNWCKRFMDRCYQKTGIRPILYTNEARVKSIDWKEVVAGNYALWVAKYGTNLPFPGIKPTAGQFGKYLIWQYTSRGSCPGIDGYVDLNTSDYSLEVLKKYGKTEKCTKCCPVHCG